jgi:hypothetical protein
MVNSSKNILLIVEGAVDEVDFFEVASAIYFPYINVEYYSYCTSIYELYQKLESDENYDIIRLLKVKARNENDIKSIDILSKKFTDIYLIFDLDPHHHKYNKEAISKMLDYFNDSMDNGKLYINYPMMQSYKHFSRIPCLGYDFRNLTVKVADCYHYKNYVHLNSCISDVRKFDFKTVSEIMKHNIFKCNYLLHNKYSCSSFEEYLRYDYNRILQIQDNLIVSNEELYVLNTSIFLIVDYLNNENVFKAIMKV